MRQIDKFLREKRSAMLVIAGLVVVVSVLAITMLSVPTVAEAAGPVSVPAGVASKEIPNEHCLACHDQENMSVALSNGDVLRLTIDPTKFEESVHGQNELQCVTCHSNIESFPHPENTARSLRDWSLGNYTTCQQCHAEQFSLTLDSVHQRELAAGNTNAAVCVDCHNPHAQPRLTSEETGALLNDARMHIPETCAKCHSAIYNAYRESIHGSALAGLGNVDVPTCIDCHGVHNIGDPTTEAFRLASPTEMCGRCHTNPDIMDKYNISTDVLDTYVADFHGTTVTLFERESPDQATNKPVCFDCHGVHDIKATSDPEKGLHVKENILRACQKCHPDATVTTFTDAWLGHYIPDAEKYPLVYFVNLFYMIFIPAVLGPMIIFVISDFVRRMIDRQKGKAHS